MCRRAGEWKKKKSGNKAEQKHRRARAQTPAMPCRPRLPMWLHEAWDLEVNWTRARLRKKQTLVCGMVARRQRHVDDRLGARFWAK